MLQTLRVDKSDPPSWGETYSREMRQWTYVVGNASRYRETTLAVVCREGIVRRVWKRYWQEFGENEEWSTFMIVECELQPWAQVANIDSLVVATVDIAPEATMLTAIELLRSFAMAALQHQVRVAGGGGGTSARRSGASGASWNIMASARTWLRGSHGWTPAGPCGVCLTPLAYSLSVGATTSARCFRPIS